MSVCVYLNINTNHLVVAAHFSASPRSLSLCARSGMVVVLCGLLFEIRALPKDKCEPKKWRKERKEKKTGSICLWSRSVCTYICREVDQHFAVANHVTISFNKHTYRHGRYIVCYMRICHRRCAVHSLSWSVTHKNGKCRAKRAEADYWIWSLFIHSFFDNIMH